MMEPGKWLGNIKEPAVHSPFWLLFGILFNRIWIALIIVFTIPDKEETIMNDFKVNQQELQKAVIWSEILSKPKALQKRS